MKNDTDIVSGEFLGKGFKILQCDGILIEPSLDKSPYSVLWQNKFYMQKKIMRNKFAEIHTNIKTTLITKSITEK